MTQEMRRGLIAALAAVLLGACGGTTGQRLYRHGGCARCHGARLTGSHLAPSLKDLDQRWTREDLDRFLRDPLGYKETDPRLKELARRYPAPMPPFVMRDADRRLLIDYLMETSRR
jgi:mono/diheme cytochrome c family protein